MTTVKGKALRGDLALYNGVDALESRRDSTGGTFSGLPVGDSVDVLQIFGDGETRTQTTINQATSILGSRNRTLHFSVGTWDITANTTIPSNFTSHIPAGCVFNVASGITLTFSGPIVRESDTWTSGSGSVSFSSVPALSSTSTVSDGAALVGYKLQDKDAAAVSTATATTVQRKLDREVWIEDFGAVPNDSTVAAANYTAIRNALKHVLSQVSDTAGTFETIDTVPTLRAGPGNFWVQGASVLGLTRTEIAALGVGSAQYRRGFQFIGSGRESTIITLKNTGAETWLYSNADASFPSDPSTAQHFVWKDFTVRAEHFTLTTARKYKVTAANTINGFYMESQGWEAFWSFENLHFEGLDTCFKWRGDGNCDQHTFKHVRWLGITDKIFDINNDQSVGNRVFGGDVILCYGDVFYIGEKGGGDFSWYGGTITGYPAHASDNLPDSTTAAANPRGVLHYNLGTKSSGVAPAAGNAKFLFDSVRFEFYDDYQYAFFAERDDVVNYGKCYGLYRNCRFTVEEEYADDATSSTARNSFRDLVKIDRQTSIVNFECCEFNEYQRFRVTDVGGSSAANAFAQITVRDSGLQWDTSDSAKGCLATRFYADVSASDRCNARFVSEGNYTISVSTSNSVACEDFHYTAASGGGVVLGNLAWANIKPKHLVWPSTTGSDKRLYLPQGSVITSVFVNKPAADSGTGSATYRVELWDQASNVLYTSGNFQEENAFVAKADLSTPFEVPAAPNNFVRLQAVNGGGGTVVQSDGGTFLVGYFTGGPEFTGTRP